MRVARDIRDRDPKNLHGDQLAALLSRKVRVTQEMLDAKKRSEDIVDAEEFRNYVAYDRINHCLDSIKESEAYRKDKRLQSIDIKWYTCEHGRWGNRYVVDVVKEIKVNFRFTSETIKCPAFTTRSTHKYFYPHENVLSKEEFDQVKERLENPKSFAEVDKERLAAKKREEEETSARRAQGARMRAGRRER